MKTAGWCRYSLYCRQKKGEGHRVMVSIENLTVRYGSFAALEHVSLEVGPGEFVLVTGPSGCGKSTLARCLNGLIPHAISAELEGRIVVAGKDTASSPICDLATSVGMVFQNPSTQLFNLTVEEEVAFGARNLGLDEEEVARRVDWALDATLLTGLRPRSTHSLSGGEQQRLAIAAVLAMGPRVLVLDEPTSSLDVRSTQELMTTLTRLNSEEGVTVVILEHRLGEVARRARRTIIMDRGRTVADGSTPEVFADRRLLRELGIRRPVDKPQRDWTALLVPNGHPPGTPVVELQGIEAGYGRETVLRDLDLCLYSGEFAALVGDNGAGKSTLARVLAGLIKPRRGEIRLSNGRRPVPGSGVGLLFQNPLQQLFCDTVIEEVGFGAEGRDLERVLEATDLSGLCSRSVYSLSSGQQQRTTLAAILAMQPQVLILDEPTMGQDWGHLSAFMDFLLELNRAGSTILVITHDYKLVHHYARRILLLRNGRIVSDGAPGGPRNQGGSP